MNPNKSQCRFNLTNDVIERIKYSADRSGNNLAVIVEQSIFSSYQRNTKAESSKGNMNDRNEK